ncbi:hypothetical protein AB0F93_00045 [Micromonospora tulbaghiae]|uniref:hypothetical protein n=1 Tax=Micromonospora tulbaghiae TaxID=479978 RepID=UPI00332EA1B6
MSETSYPVAGGGAVVDRRYEKLLSQISGAGFLGSPTRGQAMYADSTGRQIKLAALLAAIIFGYRWETDGDGLTVPVEPNTSGLPRLDLGVLRLDRSTWTVRFALKVGTPAAAPVAPAVTQNDNDNGVWEIPVGTVRVASTTSAQASAGLPSIAAADVTPLEFYLAPPPLLTHSSRMGSVPVRPGQQVTQYDRGRTYTGMGTSHHLTGENGPWVKLAVKSGWDNANCWVMRRNGFVYMQAILYRDTPGRTTKASTDIVLFNLPVDYRPPVDGPPVMYLDGSHGDWFARCYLSPTTGDVGILGYANPLADNQFVIIHPVTWPARY